MLVLCSTFTLLSYSQITPEKFEKLSADILGIIGQGSPTIFKGVILLVRIKDYPANSIKAETKKTPS
jgi:hypothetical protein